MTMTDMEKLVWAATFAQRKSVGVQAENAAAFACVTVRGLREMNTGLLCRTEWIREMLQDVLGRELTADPTPTVEPDAMSLPPAPPPLPGPPPLPRHAVPEPPEPTTLPPPPKKEAAKKAEPPKRNLRW